MNSDDKLLISGVVTTPVSSVGSVDLQGTLEVTKPSGASELAALTMENNAELTVSGDLLMHGDANPTTIGVKFNNGGQVIFDETAGDLRLESDGVAFAGSVLSFGRAADAGTRAGIGKNVSIRSSLALFAGPDNAVVNIHGDLAGSLIGGGTGGNLAVTGNLTGELFAILDTRANNALAAVTGDISGVVAAFGTNGAAGIYTGVNTELRISGTVYGGSRLVGATMDAQMDYLRNYATAKAGRNLLRDAVFDAGSGHSGVRGGRTITLKRGGTVFGAVESWTSNAQLILEAGSELIGDVNLPSGGKVTVHSGALLEVPRRLSCLDLILLLGTAQTAQSTVTVNPTATGLPSTIQVNVAAATVGVYSLIQGVADSALQSKLTLVDGDQLSVAYTGGNTFAYLDKQYAIAFDAATSRLALTVTASDTRLISTAETAAVTVASGDAVIGIGGSLTVTAPAALTMRQVNSLVTIGGDITAHGEAGATATAVQFHDGTAAQYGNVLFNPDAGMVTVSATGDAFSGSGLTFGRADLPRAAIGANVTILSETGTIFGGNGGIVLHGDLAGTLRGTQLSTAAVKIAGDLSGTIFTVNPQPEGVVNNFSGITGEVSGVVAAVGSVRGLVRGLQINLTEFGLTVSGVIYGGGAVAGITTNEHFTWLQEYGATKAHRDQLRATVFAAATAPQWGITGWGPKCVTLKSGAAVFGGIENLANLEMLAGSEVIGNLNSFSGRVTVHSGAIIEAPRPITCDTLILQLGSAKTATAIITQDAPTMDNWSIKNFKIDVANAVAGDYVLVQGVAESYLNHVKFYAGDRELAGYGAEFHTADFRFAQRYANSQLILTVQSLVSGLIDTPQSTTVTADGDVFVGSAGAITVVDAAMGLWMRQALSTATLHNTITVDAPLQAWGQGVAFVAEPNRMDRGIAGRIDLGTVALRVTAREFAFGIQGGTLTLSTLAEVPGSAQIQATAGNIAYGIYADELVLGNRFTATLTATGNRNNGPGHAYGLFAKKLQLDGDFAATVRAQSQSRAYGVWAEAITGVGSFSGVVIADPGSEASIAVHAQGVTQVEFSGTTVAARTALSNFSVVSGTLFAGGGKLANDTPEVTTDQLLWMLEQNRQSGRFAAELRTLAVGSALDTLATQVTLKSTATLWGNVELRAGNAALTMAAGSRVAGHLTWSGGGTLRLNSGARLAGNLNNVGLVEFELEQLNRAAMLVTSAETYGWLPHLAVNVTKARSGDYTLVQFGTPGDFNTWNQTFTVRNTGAQGEPISWNLRLGQSYLFENRNFLMQLLDTRLVFSVVDSTIDRHIHGALQFASDVTVTASGGITAGQSGAALTLLGDGSRLSLHQSVANQANLNSSGDTTGVVWGQYNVWQSGNLMNHLSLRAGAAVGIAAETPNSAAYAIWLGARDLTISSDLGGVALGADNFITAVGAIGAGILARNLTFAGDLAGTVGIRLFHESTGTSYYHYGIATSLNLTIQGDLSGTVYGRTAGIDTKGSLTIDGALSGTVIGGISAGQFNGTIAGMIFAGNYTTLDNIRWQLQENQRNDAFTAELQQASRGAVALNAGYSNHFTVTGDARLFGLLKLNGNNNQVRIKAGAKLYGGFEITGNSWENRVTVEAGAQIYGNAYGLFYLDLSKAGSMLPIFTIDETYNPQWYFSLHFDVARLSTGSHFLVGGNDLSRLTTSQYNFAFYDSRLEGPTASMPITIGQILTLSDGRTAVLRYEDGLGNDRVRLDVLDVRDVPELSIGSNVGMVYSGEQLRLRTSAPIVIGMPMAPAAASQTALQLNGHFTTLWLNSQISVDAGADTNGILVRPTVHDAASGAKIVFGNDTRVRVHGTGQVRGLAAEGNTLELGAVGTAQSMTAVNRIEVHSADGYAQGLTADRLTFHGDMAGVIAVNGANDAVALTSRNIEFANGLSGDLRSSHRAINAGEALTISGLSGNVFGQIQASLMTMTVSGTLFGGAYSEQVAGWLAGYRRDGSYAEELRQLPPSVIMDNYSEKSSVTLERGAIVFGHIRYAGTLTIQAGAELNGSFWENNSTPQNRVYLESGAVVNGVGAGDIRLRLTDSTAGAIFRVPGQYDSALLSNMKLGIDCAALSVGSFAIISGIDDMRWSNLNLSPLRLTGGSAEGQLEFNHSAYYGGKSIACFRDGDALKIAAYGSSIEERATHSLLYESDFYLGVAGSIQVGTAAVPTWGDGFGIRIRRQSDQQIARNAFIGGDVTVWGQSWSWNSNTMIQAGLITFENIGNQYRYEGTVDSLRLGENVRDLSLHSTAAGLVSGIFGQNNLRMTAANGTALGAATSLNVTTTADYSQVCGIFAFGNLDLNGDLAGTIQVTATAAATSNAAHGIASDGKITIAGELSGTVLAWNETQAVGIGRFRPSSQSAQGVTITGELSGVVAAVGGQACGLENVGSLTVTGAIYAGTSFGIADAATLLTWLRADTLTVAMRDTLTTNSAAGIALTGGGAPDAKLQLQAGARVFGRIEFANAISVAAGATVGGSIVNAQTLSISSGASLSAAELRANQYEFRLEERTADAVVRGSSALNAYGQYRLNLTRAQIGDYVLFSDLTNKDFLNTMDWAVEGLTQTLKLNGSGLLLRNGVTAQMLASDNRLIIRVRDANVQMLDGAQTAAVSVNSQLQLTAGSSVTIATGGNAAYALQILSQNGEMALGGDVALTNSQAATVKLLDFAGDGVLRFLPSNTAPRLTLRVADAGSGRIVSAQNLTVAQAVADFELIGYGTLFDVTSLTVRGDWDGALQGARQMSTPGIVDLAAVHASDGIHVSGDWNGRIRLKGSCVAGLDAGHGALRIDGAVTGDMLLAGNSKLFQGAALYLSLANTAYVGALDTHFDPFTAQLKAAYGDAAARQTIYTERRNGFGLLAETSGPAVVTLNHGANLFGNIELGSGALFVRSGAQLTSQNIVVRDLTFELSLPVASPLVIAENLRTTNLTVVADELQSGVYQLWRADSFTTSNLRVIENGTLIASGSNVWNQAFVAADKNIYLASTPSGYSIDVVTNRIDRRVERNLVFQSDVELTAAGTLAVQEPNSQAALLSITGNDRSVTLNGTIENRPESVPAPTVGILFSSRPSEWMTSYYFTNGTVRFAAQGTQTLRAEYGICGANLTFAGTDRAVSLGAGIRVIGRWNAIYSARNMSQETTAIRFAGDLNGHIESREAFAIGGWDPNSGPDLIIEGDLNGVIGSVRAAAIAVRNFTVTGSMTGVIVGAVRANKVALRVAGGALITSTGGESLDRDLAELATYRASQTGLERRFENNGGYVLEVGSDSTMSFDQGALVIGNLRGYGSRNALSFNAGSEFYGDIGFDGWQVDATNPECNRVTVDSRAELHAGWIGGVNLSFNLNVNTRNAIITLGNQWQDYGWLGCSITINADRAGHGEYLLVDRLAPGTSWQSMSIQVSYGGVLQNIRVGESVGFGEKVYLTLQQRDNQLIFEKFSNVIEDHRTTPVVFQKDMELAHTGEVTVGTYAVPADASSALRLTQNLATATLNGALQLTSGRDMAAALSFSTAAWEDWSQRIDGQVVFGAYGASIQVTGKIAFGIAARNLTVVGESQGDTVGKAEFNAAARITAVGSQVAIGISANQFTAADGLAGRIVARGDLGATGIECQLNTTVISGRIGAWSNWNVFGIHSWDTLTIGTISGTVAALTVSGNAVAIAGGGLSTTISGTLFAGRGDADIEKLLNGELTAAELKALSAHSDALVLNGQNTLEFTETSKIYGSVATSTGDDVIAIGRGATIAGGIRTGLGGDRVTLAAGANVSGAIDLGGGEDTLALVAAAGETGSVNAIVAVKNLEVTGAWDFVQANAELYRIAATAGSSVNLRHADALGGAREITLAAGAGLTSDGALHVNHHLVLSGTGAVQLPEIHLNGGTLELGAGLQFGTGGNPMRITGNGVLIFSGAAMPTGLVCDATVTLVNNAKREADATLDGAAYAMELADDVQVTLTGTTNLAKCVGNGSVIVADTAAVTVSGNVKVKSITGTSTVTVQSGAELAVNAVQTNITGRVSGNANPVPVRLARRSAAPTPGVRPTVPTAPEYSIAVSKLVVGAVYGTGDAVKGRDTLVDLAPGGEVRGNLYGSGKKATIDGNTFVRLQAGSTVNGKVYSGGESATVKGRGIVVWEGATLVAGSGSELFAGTDRGGLEQGAQLWLDRGVFTGAALYGGGDSDTIRQGTRLDLNGLQADDTWVYGGGKNSAIFGDATGDAVTASLTDSQVKSVYGGGLGGTITGNINLSLTQVTVDGGNGILYGGGASNVTGEAQITVNGADNRFAAVYGGAFQSGSGVLTVAQTRVDLTGAGKIAYQVYGGGRTADGATGSSVVTTSRICLSGAVTLTDGALLHLGGAGTNARVGTAILEITALTAGTQLANFTGVLDGGYASTTTTARGTLELRQSAGQLNFTLQQMGTVKLFQSTGIRYGASEIGAWVLDAESDATIGTITTADDLQLSGRVTVDGMAVAAGANAVIADGARVNADVIIGGLHSGTQTTAQDGSITLSNSQFGGHVFTAGKAQEAGTVWTQTGDIDITMQTNASIDVNKYLFGGVYAAAGATGNLAGNVNLNLTDAAVKGNLAGGGYASGANAKSTLSGISNITVAGTTTIGQYLFGGGYAGNGAEMEVNAVKMKLTGAAGVNYVVGGGLCFDGTSTVVNGVQIDIDTTGKLKGMVAAGGYALTGAAGKSTVRGGTRLTISNGSFNHLVVGGGVGSGGRSEVIGGTQLTIAGGNFANNIYGGGYTTTAAKFGDSRVTGDCQLTVDATQNVIQFAAGLVLRSGGSANTVIDGSTILELRGDAAKLQTKSGTAFAGTFSGGYAETTSGQRILRYNNFSGDFSGQLLNFTQVEYRGDAKVNYKQAPTLTDLSVVFDLSNRAQTNCSTALWQQDSGTTLGLSSRSTMHLSITAGTLQQWSSNATSGSAKLIETTAALGAQWQGLEFNFNANPDLKLAIQDTVSTWTSFEGFELGLRQQGGLLSLEWRKSTPGTGATAATALQSWDETQKNAILLA